MGLGVAVAWWCMPMGLGNSGMRCNTGQPWVQCTFKSAQGEGPPREAAAPICGTAGEHAIVRGRDCFASFNPEQNLRVEYGQDGFSMEVANGHGAGCATFTLCGLGRSGAHLPEAGPAVFTLQGNKLEVDHGAFSMHYRNSAEGMRHDLVVRRKVAGRGPLEARFRLSGGLVAMQATAAEVVFHRFDARTNAMKPVIRYNGLKAWDASGHALQASMRLEADGLVLAVLDEHASYPITIDPLSSTADLEVPGTQAGESFGYSVATAGDVNGDGYSDVLVGSPNWNTPFANAGKVQLFLGSAGGIASTPAWSYQGTAGNARVGASVSSAGDVNGDGYSDAVVGAPGLAGSGRALVFLGSAAGLAAGPSYTLLGNSQAGCDFGWSVAMAGDVNGDGYSDVLVGAPKYNTSGTAQGKAYCYHGAAGSLNLGWSYAGTVANAQLGYCVAGAGDLNGDGYSDAAIGAPYQPKVPTSNNGAVHLFRGNSGTGLGAAASSVQQGAGSANFGFSVSSAGDMNGDGYADLVVGAPGTGSGNGAVHVFTGGAVPALVNTPAVVLGGASAEQLGYAVALAGDANGDGYADILAGSPNTGSNRGKVQVYRGDATIALDAAHRLITINGTMATTGRFGAAVAPAGDVNGDGISDLLLAAPDQDGWGVVKVFHGAPDLPAATATWGVQGTANYQHMGECVASAGDVNADGYSDLLVGMPGSSTDKGMVMLYLGSATGLPATPSWTKQGENINDGFGRCVASAGDVNGDGYSDVLVGAPGWPFGVTNQWQGKAYLFLGSAGGLSASAAWTKTGPQTESRFGYSLSSAGDVNGDGYSDVIIGAYTQVNAPGTGEGGAYVFHGSGAGLPATASWSVVSQQHSPSNTSAFGTSVSLAGDVNGDGYDDVIIGDNYYEHAADGGANRGGAFVFHGSAAGLSATPDWAAYGANYGDEFGNCVSFAGDVNGDGYSDVVIGAYHIGGTYLGGAYLYQGAAFTGLQASPAWAVGGVLDGDMMGNSVAAAGDVNGDGYGDVVVGTYMKDWLYVNGGGVEVYLGSAAGLPGTADWSVLGSSLNNELGTSVALAGDVNGDGYSDIAAGMQQFTGSAYTDAGGAALFPGNAGRPLPMPAFQYRSNLATPVRTGNGTFQSDCQWGIGQLARSSMGRCKVRLVWEVAGHGPAVPTNFFGNNSTAFSGQQAGWTDSGLPGVLLKQVLSTVAGTTGHPAWRARIGFHRSTALDGRVYGRWYRQGIHDLQVPSIRTYPADCGPLPVTMVGASANCGEEGVLVDWATASEQDCAWFTVQRSRDAEHWENIGSVACGGNSSQLRHYRFVDRAPLPGGISYYRLRQVDINGAADVFAAMPLAPCGNGGALAAWPNPFGDELQIALPGNLDDPGGLSAVFRDLAGRIVMRHAVSGEHGTTATIGGLSPLPPGAYWVELSTSGGTLIGRVMVMRM